MNIVLVSIFAYILSQLVFAFWFAKRSRNEEDYIVAGRSLGPWMATFSVFATWYGAESCIGAASEAYAHGLSGTLADPFAYAFGIVVVGMFFAASLWKRGLLTLADLFRNRYNLGVARLAAIIMIPGSILWAAAQVRAFGQVLASASEMSLMVAIATAAIVVVAYTAIGGMWSNAVLDLIQGVVLLLGVMGLFVVFIQVGGLQAVASLPPERVDFMHERSIWEALDTLAIPIFSTIAAQELVARVLSVRSARLSATTTIGAGLLYLAMGLIPVTIGLGAGLLIGTDADPEQVLALFAEKNLPLPLYILFLAALVSAILSTLSGALLVAASLAAHNVVVPLRPGLTEAGKLRINRTFVVLFGIAAYFIALSSESVYELVQEAGGLGSSGVLVLMIFALWIPRVGSSLSAYATLITGTAVYVVSNHFYGHEQPYLISLGSALAVYLICAVLQPPPRPLLAAA